MSQKGISRWLKAISVVIALMGIVFFFIIMPHLAYEIKVDNPDLAYLYWPGMIYGWGVGIGCYAILYFFWRVSCEIGKDNSFSKENTKSFVYISYIAFGLAVYWFGSLVFLGFMHCVNPGITFLLIGAILVSIIIAILAATLSRLILKAYELKSEGELTI